MTDVEKLILDNQYAIMMELYRNSKSGSCTERILDQQLNNLLAFYKKEAGKLRKELW